MIAYRAQVLGLLLVAVSLGVSNLAASIGIGLAGVDHRVRIRVAVVFGFFEVTMPLIGLAIGRPAADGLGTGAHQLGGGLLVAVGLYEVLMSISHRREDTAEAPTRTGRLLVSGLALSIDNLVVGFALGALAVGFLAAAVTISVVSVAMSLVGLEVGRRLGATTEINAAMVGGLVLVAVGVAIAAGLG